MGAQGVMRTHRGGWQSQIEDDRYSFLEMTCKLTRKAPSDGSFIHTLLFLNIMEYGGYRKELFLLIASLAQI